MNQANLTSSTNLLLANSPAEFGNIFRRERNALGLTQTDAASKMGCRRQTVADLEAGKNVTSLVLFKALGVIGKQLQICALGLDLENVREFLGSEWEE